MIYMCVLRYISCRKKPVGVNDAIFVVETTKLRHPHDLKADDFGSWIHKGKLISYFQVERSPSGIVYSTDPCTEATKSPRPALTLIIIVLFCIIRRKFATIISDNCTDLKKNSMMN